MTLKLISGKFLEGKPCAQEVDSLAKKIYLVVVDFLNVFFPSQVRMCFLTDDDSAGV